MNVSSTTHTNAGTYSSDSWSFAGNSNYNAVASTTIEDKIGKADAVITVTPYDVTYDGNSHTASFTAVGVESPTPVNLSSLMNVTNTVHVNVGTYSSDSWNFAGNLNYNAVGNTIIQDIITKRDLTVTATGINKVYDGNSVATVILGTNKVNGDNVISSYTSASFDEPNSTLVGIDKPITVNGISISGTSSGNYNLVNTTVTTDADITLASTNLTLTLSGYQVRYMDNLTYSAVVKPLNTATPLIGQVKFDVKSGSIILATYSANVVPIPGSVDGSVQAMLINQLPSTVLPGSYTVTASFISSNLNYSGSTNTKNLIVDPRTASPYTASGFYVGDGFAWTTDLNTSTATLTMVAAIKDTNNPSGDVRGAKVSFYFVNGTTLTAIPNAQNLPVGLVDVTDGSVGTASAIAQLNIGALNSDSFQIAIKVTGAYTNNPWEATAQSILTVSKPITGGFITGGSNLSNTSASSGYIKGAAGLNTDFQFDIQYTKSGTNPKGKVNILVRSWYDSNGILDSKLHTYLIKTNSIASLAIANPLATGNFSAKANMVEQLQDGTTVSVESGATFQMVVYQNACTQQIAITYYRKAGGIWFSNKWNTISLKSELQAVNTGSQVYVAGGGNCTVSGLTTARISEVKSVVTVQEEAVDVIKPTPFKAMVYPNPSISQFNVAVEGESTENIKVLVYDSTGRLLKVIDKKDGETIQFGEDLPIGSYITKVSQGTDSKTINVMKR